MRHLDTVFPGYRFTGHVGYGTAVHRQAIADLGVTPLHRLSFAPLQQYGYETPVEASVKTAQVTTKQRGDAAEDVVVNYLTDQGHTIVARNWRTKLCEIDIVSQCGDDMYFTEVKYRKNDRQGGGIAAITPKKLRQMTFATELFVAKHNVQLQPQLAVADVTGRPPTVVSYLKLT